MVAQSCGRTELPGLPRDHGSAPTKARRQHRLPGPGDRADRLSQHCVCTSGRWRGGFRLAQRSKPNTAHKTAASGHGVHRSHGDRQPQHQVGPKLEAPAPAPPRTGRVRQVCGGPRSCTHASPEWQGRCHRRAHGRCSLQHQRPNASPVPISSGREPKSRQSVRRTATAGPPPGIHARVLGPHFGPNGGRDQLHLPLHAGPHRPTSTHGQKRAGYSLRRHTHSFRRRPLPAAAARRRPLFLQLPVDLPRALRAGRQSARRRRSGMGSAAGSSTHRQMDRRRHRGPERP